MQRDLRCDKEENSCAADPELSSCYRRPQPRDRLAWLKDVRTTLERHNIGWTRRGYCGRIGVVTKEDGKDLLDEDTAKTLGPNQ